MDIHILDWIMIIALIVLYIWYLKSTEENPITDSIIGVIFLIVLFIYTYHYIYLPNNLIDTISNINFKL